MPTDEEAHNICKSILTQSEAFICDKDYGALFNSFPEWKQNVGDLQAFAVACKHNGARCLWQHDKNLWNRAFQAQPGSYEKVMRDEIGMLSGGSITISYTKHVAPLLFQQEGLMREALDLLVENGGFKLQDLGSVHAHMLAEVAAKPQGYLQVLGQLSNQAEFKALYSRIVSMPQRDEALCNPDILTSIVQFAQPSKAALVCKAWRDVTPFKYVTVFSIGGPGARLQIMPPFFSVDRRRPPLIFEYESPPGLCTHPRLSPYVIRAEVYRTRCPSLPRGMMASTNKIVSWWIADAGSCTIEIAKKALSFWSAFRVTHSDVPWNMLMHNIMGGLSGELEKPNKWTNLRCEIVGSAGTTTRNNVKIWKKKVLCHFIHKAGAKLQGYLIESLEQPFDGCLSRNFKVYQGSIVEAYVLPQNNLTRGPVAMARIRISCAPEDAIMRERYIKFER